MLAANRVILDIRGLMLHSYYAQANGGIIKAEDGVDAFLSMYLKPILKDHAPIDIIAVMEGTNGNMRRRALDPTYKNKKSQDEGDIAVQVQKDLMFNTVREILLGLGCLTVRTPYAEADDTIGYLVERLQGQKFVYTVDNDLLQLKKPNDGVSFIVKNKWVNEYKGIPLEPHNVVLMYKSIVGDSSDNIPGVRGLAEGFWNKLVADIGIDGIKELEPFVRHSRFNELAEYLPHPLLQKLYDAREQWAMSYRLATIHPEWCETNFGNKLVRPKWEKRIPSFERINGALLPLGLQYHMEAFKPFLPKIFLLDAQKMSRINRNELVKAMRSSRAVAWDYETYDSVEHEPYQHARKGGYVDVLNSVPTGASFCFGNNFQHSFYLPVRHRDTYNLGLNDLKDMLDSLDGVDLIAHNSMFEQAVSAVNMNKRWPYMLDTSIMGGYVDENKRLGLKNLSKLDLNYNQTTYREVVPAGKNMRDISGEEVLAYGADDSLTSAHLSVLYRIIMECEQTWDFYYQNDTRFEAAMLDSLIQGVPMDYARLQELKDEDRALYEAADEKLRGLLVEHCSQINEDGFTTLVVETELFERKKLEEKGKSPDEIESILRDKRAVIRAACKYTPIAPPTVKASLRDIAKIAKRLNLPGIRSVKEDWWNTYYGGINAQVEAGAEITPMQTQFLDYVNAAITDGSEPSAEALQAWMDAFVRDDKSLWSGDQLSARSPLQMGFLFYGKMGLPVVVRSQGTKGKVSQRELFELEGAPSTNENAIRTWLTMLPESDWRYQVLEAALEMRGANQRESLYYKPYPLWASPIDGRMHPQIRNLGTVTHRPSGSSPNPLQVSKTKDKGKIRSTFLPQSADRPEMEPHVIFSIDFEQQELVIMAGESGDPNLRACYTGPRELRKDVHSSTGVTIWNLRNADKPQMDYLTFVKHYKEGTADTSTDRTRNVTPIRKKYAKETNFLASYGGGILGLARKLIVPKEVSEQFLGGFFEGYPLVKEYQERCTAFAKRHGYVATCFGIRRHLNKIMDANVGIARSAERQSGNMPIQGGAANVLKIVLRKFVEQDVGGKTGALLMYPVYDELVLSCPVSKVYELSVMLSDIMEMELPGLDISLSTTVSIGKNWGEQIELDNRPSKEAFDNALAKIFSEAESESE